MSHKQQIFTCTSTFEYDTHLTTNAIRLTEECGILLLLLYLLLIHICSRVCLPLPQQSYVYEWAIISLSCANGASVYREHSNCLCATFWIHFKILSRVHFQLPMRTKLGQIACYFIVIWKRMLKLTYLVW